MQFRQSTHQQCCFDVINKACDFDRVFHGLGIQSKNTCLQSFLVVEAREELQYHDSSGLQHQHHELVKAI